MRLVCCARAGGGGAGRQGPVTSTYGEVFWTSLPEVKLPEDIVQRFKGKGMAVVGFEVDQVRKTPEGDVSLPINLAYNHVSEPPPHRAPPACYRCPLPRTPRRLARAANLATVSCPLRSTTAPRSWGPAPRWSACRTTPTTADAPAC